MNVAKMLAHAKAAALRFRQVPQQVAALGAARLALGMQRRAAAKKYKRHGWADPTGEGILVHAYTRKPHVGDAWKKIIARIAKEAMARAASGKG